MENHCFYRQAIQVNILKYSFQITFSFSMDIEWNLVLNKHNLLSFRIKKRQ